MGLAVKAVGQHTVIAVEKHGLGDDAAPVDQIHDKDKVRKQIHQDFIDRSRRIRQNQHEDDGHRHEAGQDDEETPRGHGQQLSVALYEKIV